MNKKINVEGMAKKIIVVLFCKVKQLGNTI